MHMPESFERNGLSGPQEPVRAEGTGVPETSVSNEAAIERQAERLLEPPESRQTRLERMRRCADDGKTAERIACAESGRHMDQDRGGPEPGRPGHDGGKPQKLQKPVQPPKPPRGGYDDDRPFDDDAEWGGRKRRGRRRMGRLMRKLTGVVLLLLVAIAAILFLWPRVQQALTPNLQITLPDSVAGMLPDETMGYNSVDFCNAILGESREQKELVVMEQDVEVTSQISQDLLNISLFSKQKIIHSFGTGVYTVDLDGLVSTDIAVDEASGIITVTVPHTKLTYVSVGVEKTVFEDTKKALLAVGEIKLTTEQKHILDQSVDRALNERLSDPALFLKADEIALNKVRELFQAPVNALSDAYIVKIVMD